MFGDIFFDEVVMLIGFIGMLLLVFLNFDKQGMYEFCYGLVLDIVGQGIVNLLVIIFSVVMLLCYSLGEEVVVEVIEVVVSNVLDQGLWIVDIMFEDGKWVFIWEMGEVVLVVF